MRSHQRGVTLVEILISLAVVLVGMLALYKTLTVSIVGTSASSRITQAQLRASSILEAMRNAPKPALDCLAQNAASNWAACEATCLANQTGGGLASPQSCIFTTSTTAGLLGPTASGNLPLPANDRSNQQYALVYAQNPIVSPDGIARTSFVLVGGPGNLVYDLQVTIGWADDGTAANPTHYVTLRTAVTVLNGGAGASYGR